MAPGRIRKAIGAVKDHTSISLAMVGGSNSLSNLEVAIVKATRHDENPPNQRYISEILSLTSYARTLVKACVSIAARRLNKTKNWAVALKALMLIQHLFSQGGRAFEQEIFFATRRGTRFLNMCDFRDASSKSNAWDYSAFVRTYALYLDELLESKMQGHRGKRGGYTHHGEGEEEGGGGGGGATSNAMVVKATPVSEMRNAAIFSRVHHLMQLLERFLACRPTGAAKHNRVVLVALCPIVKESFQLFHNITEIMGILIDRFMQLDVPDMVKVHEIFYRISKQFNELDFFYDWCKTVGIMRFSEYPNIEKIPQTKLDMMNDFIHQKSAMLQNKRRVNSPEPGPAPIAEARKAEPEKALPQPEGVLEETKNKEEETDEVMETKQENEKIQEVGDLLNLYEDAPGIEERKDKFALALFESDLATTAPISTTTPWEAFTESSEDWEMALVQSASHLSNQKPSLPKGFDTFILDGMYQQGAMVQVVASSGLVGTGSASSVALGSAGRPTMLALPAPPAADGGPTSSSSTVDPFAASLAIAPPPYVQMSELEKKQRLLIDEQLLWQQYARDGMQGHVGYAKVQQQNSYQYIPGGYTRTW